MIRQNAPPMLRKSLNVSALIWFRRVNSQFDTIFEGIDIDIKMKKTVSNLTFLSLLLAVCSPTNAMWNLATLKGNYTTGGGDRNGTSAGASLIYLNAQSGLGIGTSYDVIPFSGSYLRKENGVWDSRNGWELRRLPLDFYYAPYISNGIRAGNVVSHNVGYLYLSVCPWVSNSSQDELNFSITGSIAHEIGVGLTVFPLMEFKLGASIIDVEARKTASVDFPAYRKSKLFLRGTLYFGYWISGANETIRTGFFPSIADRRRARENAKPIITDIRPRSAISGSTLEITGENFRPEDENTKVFFSNVPGKIQILSATKATARVPGGTPAGDSTVIIETRRGYSNEETIVVSPARPPLLTLSDVVFAGNGNDRVLRAGESGEIGFTISNAKGAGTAYGIKIYPSLKGAGSADLSFATTIDVGDVEDGNAKKVSIPLNAGLDLGTGELAFNIKVTEINDFAPESFEVKIQAQKLAPPDMQMVKLEADDRFYPERAEKLSVGNGNGIVESGEIVEVYATLENQGPGQTKDTKVDVVAGSPDVVFYSANRFILGDIPPQGSQKLKFAFLVKKSYTGSVNLPIKLSVSDNRERFNKELPLNIELKRSGSTVPTAYIPKPVTYTVEDLRIPRGSNMAVAELAAKNVSAEEASKATDFLRTNLVNTEMFNVTDRGNMEAVLAEQKFQNSGYTDQERAIQIGKLLNVKLIFAGSLAKINGKYFLTVDVINVETGRIVASAGEEIASFGKLKEACGKVVNKILN